MDGEPIDDGKTALGQWAAPAVCEPHVYLTLAVPVRLWLGVDGCVDNSMALDAVGGDVTTLLHGAVVRDAGWRAAAERGAPDPATGWLDADLAVSLRRADWAWLLGQLERWRQVEEHAELAEAVELIEAGLGESLH